MHYYQHHIGDFIRDTSRLNDSQTIAYLRLLWLYYESESPLPNNIKSLSFKIGSDESTVLLILENFFTLSDNTWIQMRCESEIRKYQMKAASAKAANKARWSNSRLKSDVKSETDQTSNQIATNNQQPITNNHIKTYSDDHEKPVTAPAEVKEPMSRDFALNYTNSQWLFENGIPEYLKQSILKDFVDYWILDESKKTAKGWQQAFRKNPVVKRAITNFKHGGNHGPHQKDTRSRSQRVTDELDRIAKEDIERNGFTPFLD